MQTMNIGRKMLRGLMVGGVALVLAAIAMLTTAPGGRVYAATPDTAVYNTPNLDRHFVQLQDDDGGREDGDHHGERHDEHRDDSGRYDRSYDDSGRYNRSYDDSGRYDRSYDDSGRYDRSYDDSGRYNRSRSNSSRSGQRTDRSRSQGNQAQPRSAQPSVHSLSGVINYKPNTLRGIWVVGYKPFFVDSNTALGPGIRSLGVGDSVEILFYTDTYGLHRAVAIGAR